MENVSLRSYNFLSDKLGTEDTVRARRTNYITHNYLSKTKTHTMVICGSKGDGLDMKGSDTDTITLFNDIHIVEQSSKNIGSNTFVMRTCDTRPGFAQLELCSSYKYTDVWCKKIGHKFFLSSSKIMQKLMSLNKNNVICTLDTQHGPCMSTSNKTHDFTLGIKCKLFIKQVQEWVGRKRRWPTEALKKTIIDSGVCTSCRNIGTRFTYQYVTRGGNKLHYQRLKEMLPFVIMGVRSDAVSGWNVLATYYYCIKEDKQEKLYYSDDKFTVDYLPHQCHDIDLSAIYIVNAVEPNDFQSNPFLIPDEMDHEVTYKGYIQKPLIVYTLFLRFMCLLKLKQTQKCLESLNDIKSFIETNQYIGNHVMKAECYTLLGIACYLKGDLTEAGNCHKKALALDYSKQFKYLKMIHKIQKEFEMKTKHCTIHDKNRSKTLRNILFSKPNSRIRAYNMENRSLRLYNFLSEKLGTEDTVKTRRTYYITHNYLTKTKTHTPFFCGSRAEGLDMKGSDTDTVILLNDIHIVEESNNTIGSNTFVMRTCDTRPGFAQLELCSSYEYTDVWCKKIGHKFFLSSSKMKQTLLSLNENNVICNLNSLHGPCVSTANETHDCTVGIKCKSFIKQAHEWERRTRRWPTETLKQIIIDSGVCTLCRNIGTRYTYSYVTQGGNKLHYQHLKEILPFVIMGVRSDGVSGWNVLATYYYCISEYSVSLKITDYVLSKFKDNQQEKLYYSEDKFTVNNLANQTHDFYLNSIYITNTMEPNDFSRNSFLIPGEMKPEVEHKGYIQKPPIVYTLFLRFVCLFKLEQMQRCLAALNEMKTFIESNNYIGNRVMKAECYTLLGIGCYLIGDLTEAGKCHKKALTLDGLKQMKYLKMINRIR
ncbi:unnamed protein product [Mytilus coruscus]|uniref:Mab-21-like HhH/H2TH-like domain-containing protein n=1 Tax=Mytilus coruscus TaxID=42192 RepID=A0A6J8CL39_MYTCO|nr:unnamed protein product [Mytilus coruscus]